MSRILLQFKLLPCAFFFFLKSLMLRWAANMISSSHLKLSIMNQQRILVKQPNYPYIPIFFSMGIKKLLVSFIWRCHSIKEEVACITIQKGWCSYTGLCMEEEYIFMGENFSMISQHVLWQVFALFYLVKEVFFSKQPWKLEVPLSKGQMSLLIRKVKIISAFEGRVSYGQ